MMVPAHELRNFYSFPFSKIYEDCFCVRSRLSGKLCSLVSEAKRKENSKVFRTGDPLRATHVL